MNSQPYTEETFVEAVSVLGWDVRNDDIRVEIGGTQVSGIDVGEVYNKKWQSPIGTRKYNKDAFIVIKNLSRSPFEPSLPMDREHKPHHLREPAEPPEVVVNMDGGVGGSWEVKEES
ncbi:hypothetical protein W1080709_172 [Synechococcus phage S-RIM2]|uniref:Uncharacterized protein n=1 Tax=Synechococcus phage S-RIM2 TaxID=687800 RepID=A0A1D7S3A8_9CAUD|nr:hypothetical protein W1080709_172 [Synechococcus phage S-RIM2]